MRTAMIIVAGIVLWGICLGGARMLRDRGSVGPESMKVATTLFIGIWFVAAGIDRWTGVTWAGFTVEQELPIFLAVFLAPSIIAVLVRWKWLQA